MRLTDRRLLLAAIVLLALADRLAGAGARLSGDEGYTWLVASAPSAGSFLHRLASFENTPPLYYLLAAPLNGVGAGWLRLPSVLAGTATVAVLYAIVRPLLGTRVALLAALALAVLPEQAAFGADARGFVLCELWLLVALWAAARLAQGRDRRWWWLWGAASVAAIYSEYYAPLFLALVICALLVLGRPARGEVLLCGLAPWLAFLPWIGQLADSLDQSGVTKTTLVGVYPSPAALRDVLVTSFFGRYGRSGSAVAGYLELAALAGALAAAGVSLWRRADGDRRVVAWLVMAVGAATFALHALIPALGGPALFAERYLVVVVPLGVVVLAGALALQGRPGWLAAGASLLLVSGGAVSGVRRLRDDSQPDPARYRALIADAGARTVLTNGAAVVYYLRDRRPVLAPVGITPALERGCAVPGRLPLAIVDDTEIGSPVSGRGQGTRVGPLIVRVVRAPEAPPPAAERC